MLVAIPNPQVHPYERGTMTSDRFEGIAFATEHSANSIIAVFALIRVRPEVINYGSYIVYLVREENMPDLEIIRKKYPNFQSLYLRGIEAAITAGWFKHTNYIHSFDEKRHTSINNPVILD